MDTATRPSVPTALLVAFGGPAAAGALLGLRAGAADALAQAGALPAVMAGTAALTLPALYIGASILGLVPAADVMARATLAALRATGLLLLGLAPALAFLIATLPSPSVALALVAAATAGAVLAGLRTLHLALSAAAPADRPPLLLTALLTGWSLAALAIGGQLFFQHVA